MLRLLTRVRNRFRYRRFADDLQEELALHRLLSQEAFRESGLGEEQARAAAARALGNEVRMRERARAVWVPAWFESLGQDARYAARGLRRSPGFAMAAVLTLVLAVGLNTSLFAVFSAFALRPWPVPEPGRMVAVLSVFPNGGLGGFSVHQAGDFREHARTLSGVIAWQNGTVRLGSPPATGQMAVQYVNGNFFDVLGVGFAAGRGFRADEDRPGAPQAVAVLSHALWSSRFLEDRGVIGRTVRIDGVAFTVVGVVGPEFTGTTPDRYGAWLPFASMALLRPHDAWVRRVLQDPADCCANVAGRLAPGMDREQARAELQLLDRQYRQRWHLEPHGLRLAGTTFMARNKKMLPLFALMFGAVLLVLLLACANVSNLMLARALARGREIAIRLSIGASRARIVRQLLTEGLVIACIAGVLGSMVALVLPGWLVRLAFYDAPVLQLDFDARILGFTLALCAAVTLLCSLAPALRATRPGAVVPRDVPIAGGSGIPLRSALMGVQLALSIVLLTGAGLMVRGVQEARTLDPGFSLADVTVATVTLPADSYGADAGRAFMRNLLSAIEARPDLAPAAVAADIPLGFSQNRTNLRLPGQDESRTRAVLAQRVSPGYFDVLRIPFVMGRVWTESEATTAVVINEALARQFWPGQSPIGRDILVGDTLRQVSGVARDSHVGGLQPVEPMYFVAPESEFAAHVLMRRRSADAALALAGVVAALDRRASVDSRPLTWYAERWLAPTRVGAGLAAAVGLLALALATLGVWGVFAYVVQERRREIGIRMAIGACGRQIAALVLRSTGGATLCGLVFGGVGAVAAGDALRGYLYGVSPLDPIALGAVLALLGVAALAATLLPLRRAVRTDPAVALRTE
jgi:macrolide transport system ATP-binding/permease protein